jgi:hypothetical protein
MPKIDVNHLQRVLQFQAERRRGRLAIIVLLHARVDQLCGWNRTSRVLNPHSPDEASFHFEFLEIQL